MTFQGSQSPTDLSATLNLTAGTAIVGSSDAGYQEFGSSSSWQTVADSQAYGGQYRQNVRHIGLRNVHLQRPCPGQLRILDSILRHGAQHPENVSLSVYDGNLATGNFLQTFTFNEQTVLSTSSWGVQSYDGYPWGWLYTGSATGTVYINQGTLTVKLPYAGANTEAPTLWVITDSQSRTSNNPGLVGGPEASQDFVTYADGGIQPCNCVVSPPPGATYSNVNQTLLKALGYGRPDSTTPQIIGDGMLVQVINVPDPCSCSSPVNTPTFIEPGFNYLPMYGTQYSLTETSAASTSSC